MSVDRLALLAHELRSPVAALTALAETAGAGPRLGPAERRRLVELAAAACRDVDRLLADPELFSVRLRTVDLAALLDAFAGERVRVDAPARLTVQADPVRLRQALANLVANGLRHGSSVSIRVAEKPGAVAVTVADDGPGVAAGIDPFVGGVSGAGSTGYGLWVARAVAEAHGGSLEAVPAAVGAAFRLALPRASGAA